MSEVRKQFTRISDFWCTLMHRGATWPIHGHYHCAKCRRVIAAPWD
ncbi:MAG: hypothetical protein JO323_01335 [Acidobacteriia bacterium]|nr:hypothetical protein [Terriglobia bacterium]